MNNKLEETNAMRKHLESIIENDDFFKCKQEQQTPNFEFFFEGDDKKGYCKKDGKYFGEIIYFDSKTQKITVCVESANKYLNGHIAEFNYTTKKILNV